MSKIKVLTLADIQQHRLRELLDKYGITLVLHKDDMPIPGSYWGDTEAGLIGNCLHACSDTPVHSVLHESCHYICMDAARRQELDTDAAGDYDEENAVCYLQILLADALPQMGKDRMMQDMDSWGYTFRLGSARSWFEKDADDARDWLVEKGIIDDAELPSYRLRNR